MKKNIETKVISSPMPFYVGCGIMILLTFILNNLLLETLLSIPATLGSVFTGVISESDMFPLL